MYGYLRMDLAEGRVIQCEEAIREFADREGFDLGMIFREPDTGRVAFAALIKELRRAESRHVIVPSMAHVWGHGASRQALVALLWSEAHAGVWVADLAANQIEIRVEDRHRPQNLVEGLARISDGTTPVVQEIRFAAVPSAVPAARLQVRCMLSRWQLVDLMAPVERAVDELVTDVLQDAVALDQHATPRGGERVKPIVMRLRKTEQLVIEIWDTRSRPLETVVAPVNRHVAALSSRCGRNHPDTGGTLTWAEFPMPARA